MKKTKSTLQVIYDGECFLCSQFKKYIDLRKKYEVSVTAAQDVREQVAELKSRGYDINQGMIVCIDDQVYLGEDALFVLDIVLEQKNLLDRCMRYCMKNRGLMMRVYPLMKGARKMQYIITGKIFLEIV